MAAVEKLLGLLESENVAAKLSKEKRKQIADRVIRGYKVDKESRQQWEERCEDALKFAKQIAEPKNFPWEGASNIIFPLLTMASNTFAARVYPEIVKDGRIVKVMHFGADQDGEKVKRADRVASHMSYQRLIKSDVWEPDTDKLLHMLPIIGVCFRKIYYDPIDNISQSDLCSPEDIVVNHTIPSLEKAYRTTHRYRLNQNEIIEKQRNKYFIDFDIQKSDSKDVSGDRWDTSLDDPTGQNFTDEDNIQIEFLEQHTFLDLDGDGYEEPWIVVVNKATEDTVGIYPRFDSDSIKTDDKGKILKITPIQYFVDYHFLPSPDGGFYSLGYGHVLYPLNEAINSLMNQLVDSGTLANTNCGLISRALKIKGGSLNVSMGEFVPVDPGTTGRLQDSVMPLDFKDPSPVLLQLLSLVIASAKEIASINEVMTGEAKPQNAPATSVVELQNQGMKLFNSISKRMYRSLKKEFQLLFKLNQDFLDQQEYFNYHDKQEAISQRDYQSDDLDIAPIADPQMGSDVQRGMQANSIAQLMQNPAVMGELKIGNVVREFFEALKIPEDKITNLLLSPEEKQAMQQQQGPDMEQQKFQLEAQKMQKDFEVKMAQVERANRELEMKYLDLQMKYELKEKETDEKQARMMADANFKNAQANHMGDKLSIEREKVDVMRQKARDEKAKKD